MDGKVILSGKMKTQIIIEGFRYSKHKGPKGPNETCYFICVIKGCTASAATTGSLSTEEVHVKFHNLPSKPHNHPPDFGKALNAEILHDFRSAVRAEPHQFSKSLHEKITVEKLQSMPSPEREEIAPQLDIHAKITRQFTRITADKNPKFKTVEEVDISAYSSSNNDVTKTKFGKSLYRGKTSSHAHFFMAQYGIEAASQCESLFVDGTFSTSPFRFFQTITLLGKVGEKVFLLGWVLVTNKLESTYKVVLRMFRDTCSAAGTDLDFSFVYMDGE